MHDDEMPPDTSAPSTTTSTSQIDNEFTISEPTAAGGIRSDFQQALLAHIQPYRRYPTEALRDHAQGQVGVAFVMSRGGIVLGITIEHSSGNKALDTAAVNTVLNAQPLPAIPLGLSDPLKIELPVKFDSPG
jgi:protein TonB